MGKQTHLFAALLLGLILLTGCSKIEDPSAPEKTPAEVLNPSLQKSGSTIDPGVVSWWPGDGNANDIIDGNPGTLKGGATFVVGKVEQAFSVDGNAGSFVEVPDAPNLNFGSTSPITVDLWAFRISTAPAQHIMGKRNDCGFSGLDINYQMGFDSREGAGLFFGAYQGSVSTGVDLPLNTWTHLAATFDGSTFRFYINGQLAGTGTGTLGQTFAVPLTIGTSGTCHQFGQGFGGLIDEVEIYNRALSASEIQAIYEAGNAGNKPTKLVTICHKPGTPAQKTLVIPFQALAGHLGHGDTIGSCQ